MLNPQELYFVASEELVEVEPTCSLNLNLIHSTYSDLVPLSISKLPLYVALELKKANLVQIRNPGFYSPSSLSSILEEELTNEREYSILPSNIFITGKLIIKSSYNCEKTDDCLNFIDKIKEARLKKTLLGLSKMEGHALTLTNMTLYEWYEIKEMVVGPMEERRKINMK